MSEQDPPDNLPRSPSGRVPKWVLDEARGEAPTELIPFRADVAVLPARPSAPKQRNKPREWISILVVIALVLAAVGYTFTQAGSAKTAAKPQSTPTPHVAQLTAGPPIGQGEIGHPIGQPAGFAGVSDHYKFAALQRDNVTPATWSPCRPIHYVMRPDNEPIEGNRIVAEALNQLTVATGFSFINDGYTTEAPDPDRSAYQKAAYGDRWAPVLIAWANADEVPSFGDDVLGEASPARITSPSGVVTYVSGMVAFDAEGVTRVARTAGIAAAEAIALHEFGHLVGLDHVKDITQIMTPNLQRNGTVAYQAGDLAGLARLGSGPCRPDV